jgi:hypothetical protein
LEHCVVDFRVWHLAPNRRDSVLHRHGNLHVSDPRIPPELALDVCLDFGVRALHSLARAYLQVVIEARHASNGRCGPFGGRALEDTRDLPFEDDGAAVCSHSDSVGVHRRMTVEPRAHPLIQASRWRASFRPHFEVVDHRQRTDGVPGVLGRSELLRQRAYRTRQRDDAVFDSKVDSPLR